MNLKMRQDTLKSKVWLVPTNLIMGRRLSARWRPVALGMGVAVGLGGSSYCVLYCMLLCIVLYHIVYWIVFVLYCIVTVGGGF